MYRKSTESKPSSSIVDEDIKMPEQRGDDTISTAFTRIGWSDAPSSKSKAQWPQICQHYTIVIESRPDDGVSCPMCGLPCRSDLAACQKDPVSRPPTDGEHDKILLARSRLLHLADVVQGRIVSEDVSDDPAEQFIRLRAAELDLQTCWDILVQFDSDAKEWIKTTHAYGLVKERFAVTSTSPRASPPAQPKQKEEEEQKIPDPEPLPKESEIWSAVPEANDREWSDCELDEISEVFQDLETKE